MKVALFALLALAGCAAGPVKLARSVDLATLPGQLDLKTEDGKALACRACGQPSITSQIALDASGHYCLLNTCSRCGASYLTATVSSASRFISP